MVIIIDGASLHVSICKAGFCCADAESSFFVLTFGASVFPVLAAITVDPPPCFCHNCVGSVVDLTSAIFAGTMPTSAPPAKIPIPQLAA
jgi:hypothetical protein